MLTSISIELPDNQTEIQNIDDDNIFVNHGASLKPGVASWQGQTRSETISVVNNTALESVASRKDDSKRKVMYKILNSKHESTSSESPNAHST